MVIFMHNSVQMKRNRHNSIPNFILRKVYIIVKFNTVYIVSFKINNLSLKFTFKIYMFKQSKIIIISI